MQKIFPTQTFSSSSLINTYETGRYYKDYILENVYYPYQYDGWIDRKHYGLKDLNGSIVYPKQSTLIEYYNNNGNSHTNINFVVDAFKHFKKYQDDLMKQNRTNNVSIFTKLNVEKSTESFPDLYLKELNRLYEIFTNTYMIESRRRSIVDVFTFMKEFINFITVISPITAFNRSSYITSKFAPSSLNGLTISLQNIQYDADYVKKANTYIADPHFDHFITSAAKFGFFVDRNFPFIMIADIESATMKMYARSRGYSSLQSIFDNCYFIAEKADIDSLKNVVLSFWNSYSFANRSQIVNSNKLETRKVYYNQLTMDTFEQLFNINWQIRLYLYIRILESKLTLNQNKFEMLYNESIKINHFSNTENAIKYINTKIVELTPQIEESETYLTSADLTIKMLASSIDPLPTEGIIF